LLPPRLAFRDRAPKGHAAFGRSVAGLFLAALAGCNDKPPVGEIAIKGEPGFIIPALVIEKDGWFSGAPDKFRLNDNGNPVVLRHEPGSYALRAADADQSACKFEVKKDRLVLITLRVVGRELKCNVIQYSGFGH
jgi:hypothetical protein